jgi:outer membrane biosynthesis protein TonB
VVKSEPEDYQTFIESATAAISHWRYRPATKYGKPDEVYFTIQVDFKLNGHKPGDVATAR